MKCFSVAALVLLILPVFVFGANSPAIIINEIMPSPEGTDADEEWVEIMNQGNMAADLSGWKIEDVAGKTKTYIFPKGTVVGPQEFLVLRRPISKITLNNEGDGLKLFRLDGAIANTVNYVKAPRGQSYSLTESGWAWSKTPTPGKPNAKPLIEVKPQSAVVGKQAPMATANLRPLSTAISLAIFSGAIILMLKRKTKIDYNKPIKT